MTNQERLDAAVKAIRDARALVKDLKLIGHWQKGIGIGAGRDLERAQKHLTALLNIHSQEDAA
jgi:hypothetical protein